MSAEADNEWIPQFIIDKAADEDSFDSHGRTASSIAQVIATNRDVKIIGLLGQWGSGKSTVVKLLTDELAKTKDSDQDLVFTYDAWLQQHDPPRRAFLEGLLHFLSETVRAEKAGWQDKLDKLNRRLEETTTTTTPRLTWPGTLMVLSLLLIPAGSQFISIDWYNAAFGRNAGGRTASAASVLLQSESASDIHTPHALAIFLVGLCMCLVPVLLGIFFYACWRPTWRIFSRDFWKARNWTRNKSPHEDDSILSLYMNRETRTDYARILRDPEPSAIEFQDAFREIVEKNIQSDRRLIIVIDNLDRLPAEDAMTMWATIRAFFLGSDGGLAERRRRHHPVVILPIAQDAIERLYEEKYGDGNANGARLARSYMDKTFDLTFHVSPPVLTKWSEFLTRQMKCVFGDKIPSEAAFITARLYDRYSSLPAAAPVTPRAINTLVNSIAATWLSWRGRVAFASVAYYCIYRSVIEADVLKAVTDEEAPVREFDPDWKNAVAALHFGVERELASEVLLEQPLRSAIAERSLDDFRLLANVPGFLMILNRIVEAKALDSNSVAINVAWLLANSGTEYDRIALTETWRRLRSLVAENPKLSRFGEAEADSALSLIRSCSPSDRGGFVATVLGLVWSLSREVSLSEEFAAAFASLLIGIEEADHECLPESIDVPGDMATFDGVAYELSDQPGLLSKIGTREDAPLVAAYIFKLVEAAEDAELAEDRIRAMIGTRMTTSCEGHASQLGAVVRSAESGEGRLRVALFVLGEIASGSKEGRAEIASLVSDGSIVSRLHQARADEDRICMARCLGLLLATESPDIPDVETYRGMVEKDDVFRGELNHVLDSYSNARAAPLTILAQLLEKAPQMLDLAAAIASRRVSDAKIGPLVVGHAIDKIGLYQKMLRDDELFKSFVVMLETYRTFWEEIDKRDINKAVALVYGILIREGATSIRALDKLRERLDGLPVDTWESWLTSSGRGLDLAVELHSLTQAEWHQLYDVLDRHISSVMATEDGRLIERWFQSASLVSDGARVNAFKKMRDRIVAGDSVANLVELVLKGGAGFIQEGCLQERADEAVRYIIEPLLATAEGRQVLLDLRDAIAPCVFGCALSTREFVSERLQSLCEEVEGEGQSLRILAEAWGVSIRPSSDEDAGGDAARQTRATGEELDPE